MCDPDRESEIQLAIRPAKLVLADGSVFSGELLGAEPSNGMVTGEVVFNTVMSGYQEVITDPSYSGQIITFTTAHLGNYGVTNDDDEAPVIHCNGVIMRQMARRHSSWRAEGSLEQYLTDNGITAIGGVDTRRLTRIIRDSGSMGAAFGTADLETLTEAAERAEMTDGQDYVKRVTIDEQRVVESELARKVVAIDCGMKSTISRCLSNYVGETTIVGARATPEEIMALSPDGVFISNGPGDPAAVNYIAETVAELLGKVPIFGICMGNQILAAALGAKTYKLPFGHHGGNHPVKDLSTGKVEITSQNHNYCVDLDGVADVEVTHVNLNDGTLEGFRSTKYPAFSVQYHPEAGPGPHDSRYLFERFAQLIDAEQSVASN